MRCELSVHSKVVLFLFFVVLKTKPRASHYVDQCFFTILYSQLHSKMLSFVKKFQGETPGGQLKASVELFRGPYWWKWWWERGEHAFPGFILYAKGRILHLEISLKNVLYIKILFCVILEGKYKYEKLQQNRHYSP